MPDPRTLAAWLVGGVAMAGVPFFWRFAGEACLAPTPDGCMRDRRTLAVRLVGGVAMVRWPAFRFFWWFAGEACLAPTSCWQAVEVFGLGTMRSPRLGSKVVMQRTATPCTSVRIRSQPPKASALHRSRLSPVRSCVIGVSFEPINGDTKA